MWGPQANIWVRHWTRALAPARALDLAGGEGRNAIWLVEQGWSVRTLDFSDVATRRARAVAQARLGRALRRFEATTLDVTSWTPTLPEDRAELVIVCYLHVPPPQRRHVLTAAAAAVAPGGRLIVIGHDLRNLTEGVGGPRNPRLLFSPMDVVVDLAGSGLMVVSAGTHRREVATEAAAGGAHRPIVETQVHALARPAPASALDAVIVADRPPAI